MLLIPSVFPRAYGRMVGDRRQEWALASVVSVLLIGGVIAGGVAESGTHGTVPASVGSASEGTEVRNGVVGSAVFGVAATASADGAADSSYDSFTAIGGGVLMANMMLGEIAPSGAGSGLYGLLIISLLAVFLGGLMIGRTPEYLGKRVRRREITFIALYGLNANTPFYNGLLGVVMLVGRYLPMVFSLGLAAAFAGQSARPVTAGTLKTHTPFFVGFVVATAVLASLLSFLPALAVGPLADALG
jgi:K+-transporting ATPase ATPase A chain